MFAGRGGFVSRKWYPLFYAAYWEDLDESYALGLAPRLALDMWRLFDERPVWGRHELRRALSGRFAKKAEFERALRLLERTMQITISGQVQPLSANGMPMGWQAMEYARVDMYLADWLSDAEPDAATARQIIRTHAFETWPSLSDAEFARCFFQDIAAFAERGAFNEVSAQISVVFSLTRLMLLTLVAALLVVGFYMAMNSANIYVLLTDGLTERADTIIAGADSSQLSDYFEDSYLANDTLLVEAQNAIQSTPTTR